MNAIVLQSNAMGAGSMIIWLVAMIAIMYFLMIRPQKNEQKRVQAMLNDLAVGDSVVTTSGFYGVILDITDDDVIVEFGNNKNCRIPMRKVAIAEVEKAVGAKIAVKGFVRMETGEGIEKKEEDFAAEVAKQMNG